MWTIMFSGSVCGDMSLTVSRPLITTPHSLENLSLKYTSFSKFNQLMPLPSEKGVYFKRKEFSPRGRKFFPFIVDTFSEGAKSNLTVVSLESVGIPF